MPKAPAWLTAKFVNTHFVDEEYHRQHSQLIHRHNDVLELLYIKQGCGSYIVDGHNYFVQPGNLIICNANILHGETHLSQHNVQSYCCVLQDLQLPQCPPNTLMDDSYSPVLSFSCDHSPAENIMLALHKLSTESPSNQDLCESLANTLLNLVYRSLRTNSAGSDRPNTEELIQNITMYLDDHYMESVSLEELGDVFYMSHYYLSHIFKAATGLSPMKYVAQRRIGEAQNLLMNTNISIGEIGEKLGFSDNCHFSSTFKRYIGITPTQYRNHFHQSVKQ